MKELIAISTLAMLLATGCASHETNRGGASDTSGSSTGDNTGAVHPGTTLGTNPSEDADTNAPPGNGPSGTETNPNGAYANPSETAPGTADTPDNSLSQASPSEQNPGDTMEANPDGTSPNQGNPDDTSPGTQPPDNGPGDNGPSGSGSGDFNLHHTILMMSI